MRTAIMEASVVLLLFFILLRVYKIKTFIIPSIPRRSACCPAECGRPLW